MAGVQFCRHKGVGQILSSEESCQQMDHADLKKAALSRFAIEFSGRLPNEKIH